MVHKRKIGKKVIFEFFAPEAEAVALGATFNDWNPSVTPLSKSRTGKWKVSIVLPSGRYEYRYLVDGIWQNDQRTVECIPNAFGTWNCVVVVP